jgi:hypothetical protein
MHLPDPTVLSPADVTAAFSQTVARVREGKTPAQALVALDEMFDELGMEIRTQISAAPAAQQWVYGSALLDCAKGAGMLASRVLAAFFAPFFMPGATEDRTGPHNLLLLMVHSPAFGELRMPLIDAASGANPLVRAKNRKQDVDSNPNATPEDRVLALVGQGEFAAAATVGFPTDPRAGLSRADVSSGKGQLFAFTPDTYVYQATPPMPLLVLVRSTGQNTSDLETAILDHVQNKIRTFLAGMETTAMRSENHGLKQQGLFRQAGFLWGLAQCLYFPSSRVREVVDVLGSANGLTAEDMALIGGRIGFQPDEGRASAPFVKALETQGADWLQTLRICLDRAQLMASLGQNPWMDEAEPVLPSTRKVRL